MTHRGPCQSLPFRDSVILWVGVAVFLQLPRVRWTSGSCFFPHSTSAWTEDWGETRAHQTLPVAIAPR